MQITEQDPYKKASSPYALDRGAPSFALVDVKNKKDQLYNLAVESARQEFNNLKQIADVINKQASDIKDKIEVTQLIYSASYNFEPKPGTEYWLANDTKEGKIILCLLGPDDWSTKPPTNYSYIQKVRCLANGLWEKTNEKK